MSDLKPCPFCGGKPYMAQNYLGQKYVRCQECGACVWGKDTDDWRITTMGEKKAEKAAVEAWNHRVVTDTNVGSKEQTANVINQDYIGNYVFGTCSFCGAPVIQNDKYCSECGAKLDWSDDE